MIERYKSGGMKYAYTFIYEGLLCRVQVDRWHNQYIDYADTNISEWRYLMTIIPGSICPALPTELDRSAQPVQP